jgi:2,4-dienoyl-CoA reductase-like NADH-dependent reductase (Old Yellow Enzyme family)
MRTMDQIAEPIRNKNVVAVIAFRESNIYATDAVRGERPTRIVATDPRGRFHKVRHHAGNPSGTYEDESLEYWQAITDAVAPAGAILVLGHGGGKANASHHWVSYVEKHRPDIAAKLVADVRIDIDHIDERQVLRLAQRYFGEAPRRDGHA